MSEEQRATTWFEIYSPDVQAALAFYGKVFGWTTQDMDMGENGIYTMLSANDTLFAGSLSTSTPQMEGVPPCWTLYFKTGDIGSTVEKIKAEGGQVMMGPFPVPDVGQIAICQDNVGAHFSIHQPSTDDGTLPATPINWVEQMGPDREKSVAFYKSVFGWGSMDVPMPGAEEGAIYSMFTIKDYPVAGCMGLPSPEVPPNWTIYMHTADLGATIASVKANGGQIMADKMEIGEFGSIAIAADPTGAVFGLHQPPAAS